MEYNSAELKLLTLKPILMDAMGGYPVGDSIGLNSENLADSGRKQEVQDNSNVRFSWQTRLSSLRHV
jgi:hypothetical protein